MIALISRGIEGLTHRELPGKRVFFCFFFFNAYIGYLLARERDVGKMEEGKRQDRNYTIASPLRLPQGGFSLGKKKAIGFDRKICIYIAREDICIRRLIC